MPRPPLCEELLHALHLRLDAGRGRLPAASSGQHLASQALAGAHHSGVLLGRTGSLRSTILMVQTLARGGKQEVRIHKKYVFIYLKEE